MKQYLGAAVIVLASLGSAPSAFAADTAGELLRSYQAAHNANNVELVKKLVDFRTQDQSRRISWLKDVSATFSSKIASITLIPFKENAFMLPESELKRLPATLKPVHWLAIGFAPRPSAPGRTESTNYLIGVENGRYFIVGP